MFADIQSVTDEDGLDRSIIDIAHNQDVILQPYGAVAECIFSYYAETYRFHDYYVNRNQHVLDSNKQPISVSMAYRNRIEVLFYIDGSLITKRLVAPKRLNRQPCFEFLFQVDSIYTINKFGLLFFSHGVIEYASTR